MVSFTVGRAREEVAAIQEGKKKLATIVMNVVEAECGKACQFGISSSPRHKETWHSHNKLFSRGFHQVLIRKTGGRELTGCPKDKHETWARPHNLLS